MRNGNGRWDNLGDDFDGMYGTDDDNEDVEFVGVIEEEATVPSNGVGGTGLRHVPSTVSRMRVRPQRRPMAPVATPQPQPIDEVAPVVVPTSSGEVRLNPDAVKTAQGSPLMQMGDHTVRRAAPGTYLVVTPSRWDALGQTPVEAAYAGMGGGAQNTGGGGFDIGGFLETVMETGGEITGSVLQYQQQQAELRARREAERAARDAQLEEARAGRVSASEQAQREFELQMERIRTLREEGREEEARAVEQALPVAPSGASPVVWVLVALAGAGAIGTAVYFATRKDKNRVEV